MKLIIDIPDYTYALFVTEKQGDTFIHKKDMVEWIKYGTPFDSVIEDIKAEIADAKIDVDLDIGNEMIYNNALNDVLEIIDKHISRKEQK